MASPRINSSALPPTPARTSPKRAAAQESCPLEQVDRLISDLESGQIRYNPEIQRGIRQQPLELGNFPCKKYMLEASQAPYKSEEMPTEIVPKDGKSLYKKAVTVDSRLTMADTEADLQERVGSIREGLDNLFAQRSESLMVLLEGDNASGKDGMVKHVFHVNPMTTRGQVAFKAATAEEREHSPNWRIMKNLAGPGQVMFHNRSHYGDVVFAAKTPEARAQRLAEIKEMEYGLTMGLPMTAEGRIALPDKLGNVEVGAVQRPPMRFIKVLVGVSQAEQAQRLAERLLDDSKIYKITQADLDGRSQHHQIQTDFANAFAAASTPWAPAYYLPNDNKPMGWRKLAEITDEVLQDMDPHPPSQSKDNLTLAQRKQLAQELLEEAAQARRKT